MEKQHEKIYLETAVPHLLSLGPPRESRLRKALRYLTTSCLVLLIAASSAMLFHNFGLTQGYSSNQVSISKAPKEEGFALWGYQSASCGGKERQKIMSGAAQAVDMTGCHQTDVEYESMRIFNGIKGDGKFGVCLYPGNECRADKPLTKEPMTGCSEFNSSQVGSFMMTWGVVGGACP